MDKELIIAINKSIKRFEQLELHTMCPLCLYQIKRHNSTTPQKKCSDCPLTLINNCCYDKDSAFIKYSKSKDTAIMINILKLALKYVRNQK